MQEQTCSSEVESCSAQRHPPSVIPKLETQALGTNYRAIDISAVQLCVAADPFGNGTQPPQPAYMAPKMPVLAVLIQLRTWPYWLVPMFAFG